MRITQHGKGMTLIRRLVAAILGAALLISAAGCGQKAMSEDMSYQDDELTVTLKTNPSTGCLWDAIVSDESVMVFDNDLYTQEEGAEDPDSAGGYDTFLFKAVGEGTATITLSYGRLWEDGATDEVRVITVTVDGGNKITDAQMTYGEESGASDASS